MSLSKEYPDHSRIIEDSRGRSARLNHPWIPQKANKNTLVCIMTVKTAVKVQTSCYNSISRLLNYRIHLSSLVKQTCIYIDYQTRILQLTYISLKYSEWSTMASKRRCCTRKFTLWHHFLNQGHNVHRDVQCISRLLGLREKLKIYTLFCYALYNHKS